MVSKLSWLAEPAEKVAPRLLGCRLVRMMDEQKIIVKIVETEAYSQSDAASHSYRGQTPRTAIMFGPPGHLYVYFTYGMHYCCNIVAGASGEGAAVLIRAVEPLQGEALMQSRRPGRKGLELTNGPAKLCQAMAIDKGLNGHNLSREPLKLITRLALDDAQIVRAARIGINEAKDIPWRFYIRDNPYVSRVA